MNLTSPSQVREWCLANGFRPNRTMGQNFLVNPAIPDRIASTLCDDGNEERAETIARQIFALATMSQRPFTADELQKFLSDSYSVLSML